MKCRICSNENNNQMIEAQEMMFGYKDAFRYFQCSSCKCLQIKDIPINMSRYYPDNYLSFEPIYRPNKIKKFFVRIKNNYAVFGKGFIGKLLYAKYPNPNLRSLCPLTVSKDTKILDVGCGLGSTLYLLSELGFKNLFGVDPFIAEDIEYDNGLKILKREIHDIEGQYDLVMFHHSFEHFPDQVGTLNIVSQLLPPGGHCLIRIPTVSSYAWDHYGVNWVQLDAPRHFYLHSIESMKILAEQAGLDLLKWVYDSYSIQFWGSEQYIKGIPLQDKRSYLVCPENSIFSKEEIAAFEKRAEELNKAEQGDQAIFYLRKPQGNIRNAT